MARLGCFVHPVRNGPYTDRQMVEHDHLSVLTMEGALICVGVGC
jgi:hypothetical protein